MIHCYIDESGNTGANLFDPIQPNFYSGAAITTFDFDKKYPDLLRNIAVSHGKEFFHANEIGLHGLKPHLKTIQSVIKRDNLRFHLARIIKKDLALAKFFDTFFDPHENRASPYHVYWALPLRFLLMIKLDRIVSDDARKMFWSALMDGDEKRATSNFKASIKLVQAALPEIHDDRSREIIKEALVWAHDNFEAIGFYSKIKRYKIPHYPNLVAFPEMLAAFERQADYHDQIVTEVKHDRQSEVEPVLRDWHEMISQASDGEISVFGRKHKVRAVPQSTFVISNSKDSAGIQLVDLILWLRRQKMEKNLTDPDVDAFLNRVDRQSEIFDLSMQYTIQKCKEDFAEIYAAPFAEKDEARALKLLKDIEQRRQEGISKYAVSKGQT